MLKVAKLNGWLRNKTQNFTNGSFKRKSKQYRILNSFNLHFDRHTEKTMMLYIPISCPLRSKGESQAAIITYNTHSSSVWHRSRWYACIMHNFCLSLHLHAHFLLMCHSSTCSVTFLLFPISLMGAEKAPPPLTFSKRGMFWCVSSFLDGPQGKEVMGEICL